MKGVSQIGQVSISLRWSHYLVIAIMIVSCFVLAGWRFDILFFRQPFPGLGPMNPLTAVLLLTVSFSFLMLSLTKRTAGYIIAVPVILISFLKIFYVAGLFDFEIDKILFADKLKSGALNDLSNSMAANTAFCFVLAGCSVLLLNYKTGNGQMPAQYLALVIILSGLLSVLGYIYGVRSFYGLLSYVPMAFHSALCFSAFSFAVFLRHSKEGFMRELTAGYRGGMVAKIPIPVAVFVPALLGLVRVRAWIRKRTDMTNEAVPGKIKELTTILDETVNTVRKISSRLRPSLLDDLGLVAATEWYLNDFKRRTGIDILFNLPRQEMELPDSINTCLFRILQESLTNVARHANVNLVVVTLSEEEEAIKLTIQDDGKGYDTSNTSGKRTLGIVGMKERAAMVGGKYTIYGKPGEGTTISIEVPFVQYLSTKSELI